MGEETNAPLRIELKSAAIATAAAIGMIAAAAVAYELLDVLLLFFLGIVVAAALQPWHVALCARGVPRGPAILCLYLFLFVGLALVALVVGPVLVDQLGRFAAEAPGAYAGLRSHLQASSSVPLHAIGQQLPPFERLASTLAGFAPQLYEGTLGVTAGIVKLPAYLVTVLAIGFYWTMEVPQVERLLLSLLAVERRPRALAAWRAIESRLGAFLRGQGLAMLFVGVVSALGYAAIGLPNVLALGVLAALLEAMPWIGPALALAPALLVALPLGAHTVFLVIAFAAALQLFESNVLIPRIMHRTVGVSALVGLLAILSFGALYGILGVLVAIPMAAVIQVLLDTMVVDVEPLAESAGAAPNPWRDLQASVRALRRQARVRLRGRSSRLDMGAGAADHRVDDTDQRIEVTVARVERLIQSAEDATEPMAPSLQAAIVDTLRVATTQVELAVEGGDAAAPAASILDGEADFTGLERATRRFAEKVEDAETLVVAARSDGAA